jgi:TonB-dependent receptor
MINVVAGGRKETNITTYFSNSSDDHTFSHWIYIGESVSHERKNSYYLPALFLNYKPTPWLSIRYAQTNTLTRPDYVSIIPLTRANGQARTLDWRNKFLEPGLSKNIDLSVSVHEDKLGLVTIGYFQKNIKDLIYASGTRIIFADDTSKFSLPSYYENYRILDYNLNNPHEVILKGWEFDYQARFWYLPRALSGFVFNANYTLTQSDVKYPLTFIEQEIDWSTFTVIKSNVDTTYTDRLLDQPNEIINLSIGYDYKGFSGRLSMLYNDDVFMSTAFWPELRQQTDAYRRWDLSMKQKLPVDGLEIFLNASNLTETNDVNRYRGETLNGDNLSTEQYYGKTIDFGFRYSF